MEVLDLRKFAVLGSRWANEALRRKSSVRKLGLGLTSVSEGTRVLPLFQVELNLSKKEGFMKESSSQPDLKSCAVGSLWDKSSEGGENELWCPSVLSSWQDLFEGQC